MAILYDDKQLVFHVSSCGRSGGWSGGSAWHRLSSVEWGLGVASPTQRKAAQVSV